MTTRFHYASQSAMLFAFFMDSFEVGRLNECMAELIQHGIGGRNTTAFAPEITLLSRIIYYTCSLVSFGRTPGQAFCDFTLSGSIASESRHKDQKELVRKLQRSDMVTIAFLYSLLPYLLQRKDKIYSQLSFIYHVLTSPEDGLSPPLPGSSNNTENSTSPPSNPTTIETEASTSATAAPVSDREIPLDSYFSQFLRAVCSSVASISTNQNDRMETFYKYAADIHRMLFLHYGSYLELPLRLMQVRMITKSPARNESSMKALSWLVGFRVSLLTYYAARVLLSEIDKQQHTSNASTTRNNSSSRSDSAADDPAIQTSTTGTTPARKCALCIDALVHPAVVPCGHIFCWNCIVPYATGNSREDVVGSAVKCPICRTEFQSQKIRALFNYV